MLEPAVTAIVDEIHAVADDKRGSHLALTLERLDHLTVHGTVDDAFGVPRRDAKASEGPAPVGRPPLRIGLSATVRPIEQVAAFLVGGGQADSDCLVIDEGHAREMELGIEIPESPLEALLSNEAWEEVYDRLAALIRENRTTLVFVNTRRMAERATRHLADRLGEESVTSHHGSLSRERRLDAERRLKAGELKAIVATASLELGIDVGTVDLVCQIGSPRAIAAFLQRVGRSGRVKGMAARGRIFATTRDELIECAALLRAARADRLDRLLLPERPLDILAQQIVAAAATRDWKVDELFALIRGAWSYRDLPREDFDAVLLMLADGYATSRGRRAARVHYDEVNGVVRGRRGSMLAAVTAGGAIPDTSDYDVILDPEGTFVGTINEDFAIESMPGDVFQLGNASWRIHKIETGRVRVTDALGEPPTIPFWLGEAPGRTAELSEEVSRLRADVERRLADGVDATSAWLVGEIPGLPGPAARQIAEYLDATRRVLGIVPTQTTLVLERFFDEAGGMQLVVHAPFGARINRAWGLSLRKRFCRSFNFELQAAANEDAIVLSLGPQHSFPLDDVFRYLNPETARELLVQALLVAPMFQTRWRWNVERALAVLKRQNGRKVAPQLLRMRAEDLLAAAFPQAAACLEHVVGDVEIPWEHPIVRQTVLDCLVEAMDVDGLEALLERIHAGELELIARDVPEPSPLAHEILNARPYAFLDDAPAEERRTLAVQTRRGLDFRSADELGTLDADAIARVRDEAWPEPENADEVHDAVGWLGVVTEAEAEPWGERLNELAATGRVTCLKVGDGGPGLWVAAERLPEVEAAFGEIHLEPAIDAPARLRSREWDRDEALAALLRGRLEGLGPVTEAGLVDSLGLSGRAIQAALLRLETEGTILRGRFSPGIAEPEWCHRRLLARIHRYTIDRLRSEIEPVAPADFMRFLFAWHGIGSAAPTDGPRGLLAVLDRLQGFETPAVSWERDLLPARLGGYDPGWLDLVCLGGHVVWGRLLPPSPTADPERPRTGPVRNTPLAFFDREELDAWMDLAPWPQLDEERLSHEARLVLTSMRERGPAFLQDLVRRTGLLPAQVERGLGELLAWGLVTADGVEALRTLLLPEHRRRRRPVPRPGRQPRYTGAAVAGRWSLLRDPGKGGPETGPGAPSGMDREDLVERLARQLLARYGVVTRRLLAREAPLAPWRELLRALWRLELRGEVRGGRFVQGMAGEQFALPEAVERLRAIRRKQPDGRLLAVSAGDPLNLAGILTPGERVAALPGNRVVYKDGVPVAAKEGRATRGLRDPASDAERREVERLLVVRAAALSGR
ncbi:MAG: DEAD/DEAH box helicase, partial [Gemmatimonadota bacterium]